MVPLKRAFTRKKLEKKSYQEIRDGLLRDDPEIFRYLYRSLGNMIIGYVRRNNGSEQDAREMVNIILVELWMAIREGRYDERGKFDRYVYMLTANTWRDELRRRKVRQTEPISASIYEMPDENEQDVARAFIKDQRIEALHQCLKYLGEPCQKIIRLYHLNSVSLQEVAQQMGYEYGNLRKRIFDCRKKLKNLVDDYVNKHFTSPTLEQ